jgi:hypothetical protein
MKMMKLLYNMKNKGIKIDEFVENIENNISINSSNLNSEKSEYSNNTFIPLYIENDNLNINNNVNNNLNNGLNIKNQINIPSLNFNDLNNKFNSDFFNNEINNNYINDNEIKFGNLKIQFNNDNSCNIIQSPISSNLNNYKNYNNNNNNKKGNSYSHEILPNNDNVNYNKNEDSNLKKNNKGNYKKNKGNLILNNKFKIGKMGKK